MGTITGSLDGRYSDLFFTTPVSLGVSCGANYYPNGTITFDNIESGGAYWKNRRSAATSINLYLCDSAGNNKALVFSLTMQGNETNVTKKSGTISGATGLRGKALYLIATGDASYFQMYRQTSVTITTQSASFNITLNQASHGTISANKSTAAPGDTVKLTATPATGYELTGWSSSPSVTITNNKFTMPASNVTISATFAKKSYTVSKAVSPSGAGTVTLGRTTATMGQTVTVSQVPNTGYYFNGWTTSPAVTISSGQFTMPASNVTVTANYLKRSTATLDRSTCTGGDTAALTINPDKTTYSHKYQLSFGTGMETALTDVAAGVTGVLISIPEAWSDEIPNAATKSGGTLTVYTYNGTTQIGSYTITDLTYAVPAGVVPEIGDITASVARTIGGTTYANIGDIYTQNKCGVRIQAEGTGERSATVVSMTASVSGYSGSDYNGTAADDEIDFTSGLLSISGTTVLTVTATDSRGRTSTKTATITVTAYSPPFGTLDVFRTDINGDPDDLGQYGGYELSKNYTAIGSNTLTVSMTSQGSTETLSLDTGDILPVSRQTFSVQQEYTITVTLQDAFETITLTAKLRTAKFIIHVNAGGDKLGFMKAANKTIPSGKNATIEFSGDAQIYIGDDTLEDYITYIVNSIIS